MIRPEDKVAINESIEAELDLRKEEIAKFTKWLNQNPGADEQERTNYNQAILFVQADVDRLEQSILPIDQKEWGQNLSIRTADPVRQVAYGECRIGGCITFATTDQQNTGEYLHIYITATGHEIDGFNKLYLDGNGVTFASDLYPNHALWANGKWANRVFCSARSLGTSSQAANSDLVGQSELHFADKWTSAHRQRGCSGVYLIMLYDFALFPNGLPEIAIKGKWKNDIYDPRDDSTGWTDNAALCLANYLMDAEFGLGCAPSEIDMDSLEIAADICDEVVTNRDGSTEKRYAANGAFQASRSNNHKDILQALCDAMGGYIGYSSGKWRFYAGAWRAPVAHFTEGDLRSGLSIKAKPSKRDVVNAVRGKYRGSKSFWTWTDYPPVRNSFYQDEDGERLWLEQDLLFTTSPAACQRIAKIRLEESRQPIEITADFSLAAMNVLVGENVTLTLERLGFDAKEFVVTEWQCNPNISASAGAPFIRLRLRETAAGVFDWNNGEETTVDLAPNTNLPELVAPKTPTGLTLESGTEHLDIRTDGTVFTRIYVYWDATTNPAMLTGGRWEVQYKKTIEDPVSARWRAGGYVDGENSNHYILDVADGEMYDVRVRAITLVLGEWAMVTGHLVIGKTAPPAAPTNFRAVLTTRGVELSWDAVPELDVSYYEIRLGSTWAGSTLIEKTAATSYLWAAQTTGGYTVLLAAKDTSGNYSDAVAVSLDVDAPSAPRNITAQVVNNMITLRWDAPATHSFPIREYRIYKRVSGIDELLGSVNANIKTLMEFTAGVYTYVIRAVDTYGNEGAPGSITIYVDPPPMFELLSDVILEPTDATTTNAIIDGEYLVMPIDPTQTVQSHFEDNSWDTPQDQIDAGFPIFIQPAIALPANVTHVIDYGATVAGCLISLSFVGEWVDGDGTVTPTIGYSTDGTTYTDTVDVSQVYSDSFRYVRVQWDVEGDDTSSIYRLSQCRLRLEVRPEEQEGAVSCASSDSGGTTITFTKPFLDVFEDSIQLSFRGSSAYIPSYSIAGNVVSVYLWTTGGARASGTVTYRVRGLVSRS